MAKHNAEKQEGPGIHNGIKHPSVESVKDAKHDPKPQKAAMGDRRASTYQQEK